MTRQSAFGSVLLAVILLPVAVGWLAYSHRALSVTCQRANGKVDCTDTERIADQNFWTQPVWTATVHDVTLTTRDVDTEGDPGTVILRTQNDTQREQFTSGMLGTNEAKVDNELHQFLVVRTKDASLQFEMAPGATWRDWGLPVGLIVLVVGYLLVSLLRLIAPSQPRAKMRGQSS